MKKFSKWVDEVWNGKHEPPSVILVPSEKIKCKYCFAEIDPRAPVCHNCKEWQRRRPLGRLFLTYASSASAIVAVISVIIAGWQLREARQKRIEAQEALEKATTAQDQAGKASQRIDSIVGKVEGQAATVDSIAKQAGDAKRISEEVQKKNQQADEKLMAIDEAIKHGNEAVAELQAYTTFNNTVLAAENDDRPAFDQLRAWADDKNYRFTKEAQQAFSTVLDVHESAIMNGGFTIPWKDGVDPSKFSLGELQANYQSAPPYLRIALLEYIWEKRTDIPKRDRMQFLVGVIQNDPSLKVVEYAGMYFSGASQDKFKRLAIKPHIEWWEKNKDSIKD